MEKIKELLGKARKDREILAVMVFGSAARGEAHRDIDICIVLNKKLESLKMSRKALQYSSVSDRFDVHVFQQLPLYIRSRILKEGKILFCRDSSALFDIAMLTIKEFEDFKPIYERHVEAVLHG